MGMAETLTRDRLDDYLLRFQMWLIDYDRCANTFRQFGKDFAERRGWILARVADADREHAEVRIQWLNEAADDLGMITAESELDKVMGVPGDVAPDNREP